MARRRDPRRQGGFTMIELLITLAVSTIAVAGVTAMHVVAARTNAGAAQSAEAVGVAERTLEEARALGLDAMLVEYEHAALPIDWDFGGQTVQGRTVTYLRRIIVEQTEVDDLLRMRAEVTWAEDGKSVDDDLARHTVVLEMLRTRQENL